MRLEAGGQISTQGSDADRRLVVLALTDKGREMVAEPTPIARAYEVEVMTRLGGEGEGFRRALSRLMVGGERPD